MDNVVNIAASVNLLLRPGLCGDFNDVEADDFITTSGLIEGTASIFASTWKMDSSCVDVNNIEEPCTMSMNKGQSPAQNQISSFSFHTLTQMFVLSASFCREIRQTLVRLAVRPKGTFCQVSPWCKPRRLWKSKQSPCFICSYATILQRQGPPADLLILSSRDSRVMTLGLHYPTGPLSSVTITVAILNTC